MVNNTYDFDVCRGLKNLDDLRKIGFAANQRLPCVQHVDCAIGAERFDDFPRSRIVDGQSASALRLGDPCVQAPLTFRVQPDGFENRDLCTTVAPLVGISLKGARSRPHDYGLRRPAAARTRRAHPVRPPLPRHRRGPTNGHVLSPDPCPDAPTRDAHLLGGTGQPRHRFVRRGIQRLWEGQCLAAGMQPDC